MDADFDVVAILIGTGFAAWIISYASKALFVDRSDVEKNVFRTLIVVLGYAGIGLIIWGLLILVAQII